jgi:hypothetical protein
MKFIRVLLVPLVGLVLTSCGSSEPKTTERQLTLDEASLLSQASFNNYDGGGATFDVNTVTAPGGPQLRLMGAIDWRTHTGTAEVSTTIPDTTLKNVWWRDDGVLELRPQLKDTISAISSVEYPVLLRRPDKSRRLDQVLAIITGLASEQAENAQLVLQKEGSAYLRHDVLRGKQVAVLRYGNQSIFWIDTETQKCLRFEGINQLGNQPIVIDFIQHGPQAIRLPPQEAWVDVEGNEQLLQLISGF